MKNPPNNNDALPNREAIERARGWFEANKPSYKDICTCDDCAYSRPICETIRALLDNALATTEKEQWRFTVWKNSNGTYGVSPTYAPDVGKLSDVEEIWFLSPPAKEASGWRRIESAPRDGTQFLIWTNRCGFSVVTHDKDDEYLGPNELNPHNFHLSVDDGKHGPYPLRGDYPTHWQPLPAAPETQAEE